MITIYPMLVSSAVPENIIPGIAKILEGYIIAYSMNDVISNPWAPKQLNYKIKAGKLFAREGEDLSEQGGTPPGAGPGKGKKSKSTPGVIDVDFKEIQKDDEVKRAKTAKAKITSSEYKAISLEPSYITTQVVGSDGVERTEYIGVKVVPLRVQSDAKLMNMLMHDFQLRKIQSLMVAKGRGVLRFAYRLVDKWGGRVSGVTPSGDPRRDVVLARSGFKGKAFVVIDKGHDFTETMLKNPARLNRLFKLGWGNFVITDNINRQAYFCMKSYKGICNIISYPMMYQQLGQLKVYESLEDAKRQNSSLFKVGPRLSKVMGECICDLKRDRYNILSEDK